MTQSAPSSEKSRPCDAQSAEDSVIETQSWATTLPGSIPSPLDASHVTAPGSAPDQQFRRLLLDGWAKNAARSLSNMIDRETLHSLWAQQGSRLYVQYRRDLFDARWAPPDD